jgi:hypothetical protein
VSRFLAGFATACALWGIGAAVYFSGVLAPDEVMEDVGPLEDEEMVEADPGSADEPRRRRRRRRTGGGGGGRDEYAQAPPSRPSPRGNATTGDDLGENDLRLMDMEGGGGGEQQLTGTQIDNAFDGAMSRIRRCLILAAGDDPVTGRLVFGMRIAGTGRATRVNLAGPAAVTTGDAGECLRGAARGIQFPTFDGPEMVVRYPLTLD